MSVFLDPAIRCRGPHDLRLSRIEIARYEIGESCVLSADPFFLHPAGLDKKA